MQIEQKVTAHYRHGALEDALLERLAATGKNIDRLKPDDLALLWQINEGLRISI